MSHTFDPAKEIRVAHAVAAEQAPILAACFPERPAHRAVDAFELALLATEQLLGHAVERVVGFLVAAFARAGVELFEDHQLVDPQPAARIDVDPAPARAHEDHREVEPLGVFLHVAAVPGAHLIEVLELEPQVFQQLALGRVRVGFEHAEDLPTCLVADERPAEDARAVLLTEGNAAVGFDVQVDAARALNVDVVVDQPALDRIQVGFVDVEAGELHDRGGVALGRADLFAILVTGETDPVPVALALDAAHAGAGLDLACFGFELGGRDEGRILGHNVALDHAVALTGEETDAVALPDRVEAARSIRLPNGR